MPDNSTLLPIYLIPNKIYNKELVIPLISTELGNKNLVLNAAYHSIDGYLICFLNTLYMPSLTMRACQTRCPKRCQSRQKNLSITLKYRVKQFPNDFCTSGVMLFSELCQHKVDREGVHTRKNHIQSKTCVKKKVKTELEKIKVDKTEFGKIKDSMGP